MVSEAGGGCAEQVETLDLRDNGLADDGAAVVADALLTHAGLRNVNMARNAVGDAGGAVVAAALKKATWLRTLVMNYNQLGVVTRGALAEAAAASGCALHL